MLVSVSVMIDIVIPHFHHACDIPKRADRVVLADL